MDKQKIIQIIQWLMIILLAISCFYFWRSSNDSEGNLIKEEITFDKNEKQTVNISNDKTWGDLKRENEELYDSIRKLSDVKEAIQVKYVLKRDIDTVYITNTYIPIDSIYHYTQNSDTINYNLDIKGKDVEWFKLDFSIQDSLMLVTRSANGQNETTISHTTNTSIKDVTVFVPKKKFSQKVKENVYFGVGVGAGYGFFNKKPDIYIGINAGIKF